MANQSDTAHLNRTPFGYTRGALHLLLCRLGLSERRFRGAFATYQDALAAVRRGLHAGYDNDPVADVSFEKMCRIALWDWPILYWLHRLRPQTKCLIDAGGHQGTKFRAFRQHLDLDHGIRWVVYDVPSMVRAGRKRAEREGLSQLSFIDNLDDAPVADVFLGSGLLQYLDIPFDEFIRRLPEPPPHLVLNKVATRDGPAVVTLEDFPGAEVPYQIRNRAEFLSALDSLGYDIVDEWVIPNLSHQISTHPHLGESTSRGYYATRRTNR